jgi:hypothetical protein
MTEKEFNDRMADTQARAEKFERLHAEGVIEYELRKAAEDAGAFNADQILPLLRGKSRLVDAGGKQVVRVVSVDGNGHEVHHSPAQAIWHLKQDKDSNGNLFKDFLSEQQTLATPSKVEKTDLKKLLANMPMDQYIKLRTEHPEVLGLNPLPKWGR